MIESKVYSGNLNSLMDIFNLGMMREYPEIIKVAPREGSVQLNIGAGHKLIEGTAVLDWPRWDAETQRIPYDNDSVDVIHCYHFLEHIDNVVGVIREMRRVIKPGGVINIVVPYWSSLMQHQDLDHKHSFTEKTFPHLFNNSYYDKGKVEPMYIHTNMIMGDCNANLCLVVQLVK